MSGKTTITKLSFTICWGKIGIFLFAFYIKFPVMLKNLGKATAKMFALQIVLRE